jgi:hypothetical protein
VFPLSGLLPILHYNKINKAIIPQIGSEKTLAHISPSKKFPSFSSIPSPLCSQYGHTFRINNFFRIISHKMTSISQVIINSPFLYKNILSYIFLSKNSVIGLLHFIIVAEKGSFVND